MMAWIAMIAQKANTVFEIFIPAKVLLAWNERDIETE